MENNTPEVKQRQRYIGIRIHEGASLYDYITEKRFILGKNIFIPSEDILDQIGHVRFNYQGRRYALTFQDNRKRYEWVKANI